MRKFLLLIVFLVLPATRAQAIIPICNGDATHDTAQFVAIEAMQGSVNSATISLPQELDPAQRCKVNTLVLTANLTLDNTDGSGIFVVTGQTLTIAGPIVSPAKPFFFNATAMLGTVSFAGNKTLTKVYPEWWGGGVGVAANTNASALNAANAALVTIGSGEIALGPGNYSFDKTLTLGTTLGQIPCPTPGPTPSPTPGPPFTAISLGGTSGLAGTALIYTGAGDAIVVQNGRFNHIHDLVLQLAVATPGTPTPGTRGIVLTGPLCGGADTAYVSIERVTVHGFDIGIENGNTVNGYDADLTQISHSSLENNNIGLKVTGANSTQMNCLNVSLESNKTYGVYLNLQGAQELNWHGGSFGRNGIGVYNHSGSNSILLDGIRDEMSDKLPNYRFYFSDVSPGSRVVISRYVVGGVARLKLPLIYGYYDDVTIRDSHFVYGTAHYIPFGNNNANGDGSRQTLRMINNYVNYHVPLFQISTSAEGLTYVLEGNKKFNDQDGTETYWPNETGRVIDKKMLSNEMLLSTTSKVDMNTATPTTLYTVPKGRTAIITKVIVRNVSTLVTMGSYSFGFNSALFDDVIANAVHLELNGPKLITILNPKEGAKLGLSEEKFNVRMHTLGGVATTTIEVYGYLN